MFENKNEPLVSRKVFMNRLMKMALIAFLATMVCLLIGILGYHYIGQLIWIDAIHNASMILSGMGPVANVESVSGKLFSSAYALFSGVAFITNISIFLSPVIHRFLHKMHLEKKRTTIMKYTKIPTRLFVDNRKRFAKELKSDSLAVFNSNDVMPSNADGSMGFIQNSDLFYLCGIDQEETILLLYPDAKDNSMKEILFLRETNDHIAIWEGHKYTKEEARDASGIKEIRWLSEFAATFKLLMGQCKRIYVDTNEHTRATIEVETREARFVKWCMEKYPAHRYERSAPIMHKLRSIKSEIEVDLIKHACFITEMGFRRLLPFIKPDVWEYEIEAELIHEFVRSRSRGFAYSPIIASGGDSCVLHYILNNKQCKKGDVILLDVAAEYANYASDMTRVVPVSGKFTKRQKDVYNAVLRVMRAATKMLVKGNTFPKYNAAVAELIQEELIKLKVLKLSDVKKQDPKNPLYRKYFMHGVSHFMGLDVHDVGFFQSPMQAGNVFTCEPGIYIPSEKIGVRIENNILITEKGNIDLMGNIPIEADEIEELMNA